MVQYHSKGGSSLADPPARVTSQFARGGLEQGTGHRAHAEFCGALKASSPWAQGSCPRTAKNKRNVLWSTMS